jgi:enoyl-CoA hydratase/carnithine racemase
VIDLTRDGDVFILRMDDNENRFSPTNLDALNGALDQVEGHPGAKALVTTGTGKFFSNGLDLDWLSAHTDEAGAYVGRVQALMVRVIRLPLPTVAALNGHTFAAGAMLSLCHDMRIMRADRGFWCLPEVDLGMAFTPGMNELIRSHLPIAAAHQAMVTGHRFGGAEALAVGIIHQVGTEDEILPVAVAHAGGLAAKASPTMGRIRSDLYADTIALLEQPI